MIKIFKRRRTQHSLGRNVSIATETIDALIRESIRLAPSAYHSQSSRAVILFGDANQRLWTIVRDELAIVLSAEALTSSLVKIDRHARGVGTVLFFEDQQAVVDLQQAFPHLAEHFPAWSEQSRGMAQFAVWTTLANFAIGASLREAGFGDEQIVEIMAHVALNLFTNYINVALDIPVDFLKVALK